MKQCTGCGEKKTLIHFSAQSKSRDGKQPKCKECNRLYRTKNKDQVRNAIRDCWDKNRDKYNKRQRDSKKSSVWKKKNPERHCAGEAQRRARKSGCVGGHSSEEIKALFSLQFGSCAICRVSLKKRYHADHINPLFLGGSNLIGNIQLLCPTCNLRKGRKDPVSFMQSIGFLI